MLIFGLVIAEFGGQPVGARARGDLWHLSVRGWGDASTVREGAAHARSEAGNEVVTLSAHFYLRLVGVRAG